MIRDQNRVIEAAQSFIGGANSSLDPALIEPDQFSWGTNIRIRGGYPKTRPGFKYIGALPGGKIQGAYYFSSGTTEVIAMSIAGRVYTMDPSASSIVSVDVTPASGGNNPDIPLTYFTDAGGFLVMQDGESEPIVYTGTSSFRSSGVLEDVPTTIVKNGTMARFGFRLTLENSTGLNPGMLVTSIRGIEPDTRIVSVDSNTAITINKAATTAAYATFNFYPPGPLKQDISIPVGGPTVFTNGRLWVARGNQLFAGDLINSYENSQIKFSEILYLTGGGAFSFDDEIVALAALPGVDTSTGQGDLVVYTRKSVFAVRSYVYDRTQWQSTIGMQRFVFDGVGEVAPGTIAGTGNDLYFRAASGVMSYVQTLKDRSVSPATLSDSTEAARVINSDTARWLRYSSGVFFDNRYLFTASPVVQNVNPQYGTGFNIVGRSIISADLVPATVKGEALDAAYDGEWTGLQVSKLVKGIFKEEEKCFAICSGTDGHNSLYEITLDAPTDTDASGNFIPIQCGVEFRRMSFENPAEVKELIRADIGFSEIFGRQVSPGSGEELPSLQWTFSFRPDYFPNFFQIQSGEIEIQTANEIPLPANVPENLRPGYLNVRTVKPSDSCVIASSRLARFGYLFQPKIEWVGSARLSLFRLHGSRKDISDLGECN